MWCCDGLMPPPCSRLYFAGTERRGPGFIRLICVLLSKIIKVWPGIVNLGEPLTFSSRLNLNIYLYISCDGIWLSVYTTCNAYLYDVFVSFNVRLSQLINNYLLFFDGPILLDDGMVDWIRNLLMHRLLVITIF